MGARPLPRSLDPLPGESLNGYLLRLSCRLRVSPLHLARLTGCIGGRQSLIGRRVLFSLDAREFARAARLTDSEAASLAAASWKDRYPPIGRSRIAPGRRITADGWLTATSTRYCPRCLAGDGSPLQQQYGGPWKKTWLLPVTFACTGHQRFLREDCPQEHSRGHGAWALIASPAIAGLHPAQCRLPAEDGEPGRNPPPCGTRLDRPRDDGLPRPDPGTLDLQERITALLTPHRPAPDAASAFTDLRLISALVCLTWPLGENLMNSRLAAAVSEHVRTLGTSRHPPIDRQPRSILATAGILTAAAAIRDNADLESTLSCYITPGTWQTSTVQNWNHVLSRHHAACSPALRDTALAITASRTTDRRKRKPAPAPAPARNINYNE